MLLQDNPLKLLGLGTDPTISEVKRAYRKMCFECHPDTGRKPPPMEFTVLGDVYERALKVVEERQKQKDENAKRAARPPPTPQPATPPTDLVYKIRIAPIDEFEIFHFDCAFREAVVDKRLQDGGTLIAWFIKGGQFVEWPIIIAKQDSDRTKIRINTSDGPLELTVIFGLNTHEI